MKTTAHAMSTFAHHTINSPVNYSSEEASKINHSHARAIGGKARTRNGKVVGYRFADDSAICCSNWVEFLGRFYREPMSVDRENVRLAAALETAADGATMDADALMTAADHTATTQADQLALNAVLCGAGTAADFQRLRELAKEIRTFEPKFYEVVMTHNDGRKIRLSVYGRTEWRSKATAERHARDARNDRRYTDFYTAIKVEGI